MRAANNETRQQVEKEEQKGLKEEQKEQKFKTTFLLLKAANLKLIKTITYELSSLKKLIYNSWAAIGTCRCP